MPSVSEATRDAGDRSADLPVAPAALGPTPADTGALPDALPRRWGVFAVVATAFLMVALDQTAVSTALPALGRDLGADLAWSSWTITIYSVGQILALPLGGRMADQFGARRVFLASITVFVLAALACGLAQDLTQLVACRLVQGLACGAVIPAGTGIVAHAFGRDRDRALALFTSVFPIGALAGPLIGGLALTVGSWRTVFLIAPPVGFVLLLAGLVLLPDPARRRPERVDLLGIVLISVTLLAGMTAVARLGSLGTGPAGPLTVAAAAVLTVVCGWLFLRHARRHPDPVVPLDLLVGRGLGKLNITNVLFGAAAIGFAALVPLYAQTRYDLLPLAAGALITARAVGMIVTSTIAVALLRRTGWKPLLVTGLAGIGAGLLITAVPPVPGMSAVAWLAIGATIMGVGMGLAAPSSSNAGMHLVPEEVTAVSGLRVLFRQVGAIIVVSVVSAVTAASSDPGEAGGWSFAVLAVVITGAVGVVFRLPNRRGRW